MTRAERAAEKVRRQKEKQAELTRQYREAMAKQREETQKAEATQRVETRNEDNKKRYHWGAIAQEKGLFVWGTSDWHALCAVLSLLVATPEPAKVLVEALEFIGVEIAPVSGFLARENPIAPTSPKDQP